MSIDQGGQRESPDGEVARKPAVDLRVCMLSFYFHPSYSGSAVQAHNLSRYLQERGIAPYVVSANLTDSPPQEILGGVRVYRLSVVKWKLFQLASFWWSLLLFLTGRRHEFGIIHAHGTLPHGIASVIAALLGKASILKIAMANSDIAFERQGRIWGCVNRWLVARFDRYIATSDEAYKECIEKGLDRKRIHLIPNGVDTDAFTPIATDMERTRLRSDLGLNNCLTVCFVGIVDVRKNVDGVLRVWRNVARRVQGVQLVIVGPLPRTADGSESEFVVQMRQFVAENHLESSVIFTDNTPAVSSYLQCSDLFFFPSRREGMPNVVLEAMASGLSCVVSNIGGIVDLVEHGKSGFVHELSDEAGMADSLVTLLSKPGMAGEFGRAARERMVRSFSLRETARLYEEMYRDMLQ